MNGALGKVLCLKNDTIFKQAFSLLRFRTSGENPVYSAGGILLTTSRHYRSKPTHGIGRYKHLVKPEEERPQKHRELHKSVKPEASTTLPARRSFSRHRGSAAASV